MLQRIIAQTENARPEIAEMLAESYEAQKIYSEAYRYYFKARNPEKICLCMNEVAKEAYESELDMFYARACVDMLIRDAEIKKTRYILKHG